MTDILRRATHVTKAHAGVQAVADASFELRVGEPDVAVNA
ncbi:hypothetical protein BH09GEM1_BH09GEM1_39010 [soil metagenome]